MKKTVTISISLDPPISGYGGWDEWQIETISGTQRDELMDAIEEAINASKLKYGTEGGYTGQ